MKNQPRVLSPPKGEEGHFQRRSFPLPKRSPWRCLRPRVYDSWVQGYLHLKFSQVQLPMISLKHTPCQYLDHENCSKTKFLPYMTCCCFSEIFKHQVTCLRSDYDHYPSTVTSFISCSSLFLCSSAPPSHPDTFTGQAFSDFKTLI